MLNVGSLSRRALVAGGAGMIAAAAGGLVGPAAAPQKVSKAAAKYQDRPKGQQRCAICVNFQPPDHCRFVQGSIAETGWCQFFAAKENAH
ncbi:MAG TPA: hypothetical protein VGR91_03500 [Stellaceae bacterium]|nr:hypothetical protein [Stellaceae bacterium]